MKKLPTPCLPGLLEPRMHPIADTSLMAFDRVRKNLNDREIEVFLGLCDFDEQYHRPATGGELAEFMGIPVTSVRPRFNGLKKKGWIRETAIQKSTAKEEGPSHGHTPDVPQAAIKRLRSLWLDQTRHSLSLSDYTWLKNALEQYPSAVIRRATQTAIRNKRTHGLGYVNAILQNAKKRGEF